MDKRKIITTTADAAAGTVGVTFKTVLKVVCTCLLIIITTGLLFACIFAYYVKSTLSTNLSIALEDFSVALSSTIYYQDSDGSYKELVTLSSEENRIWVEYDKIPKDMLNAIVAIEDKRFYDHKGVDWYRSIAAFMQMFVEMRNDFGGSTITQQLIKTITGNDANTVERKLLEIFQALELEKTYEKKDILEWYLNLVYFGEGCYGIYTAAETYFGKDVSELTLAQCASIAGITNLPSYYDPFINYENNKKRQETILSEMYEQGYITYEAYQEALAEDLQSSFVRGEDEVYTQEIYSYYVETVINDVVQDLMEAKDISRKTATKLLYSGGYQIYCSLDMDIQNQVDEIYENIENLPQSYYSATQQLQSAIVIMDPYTGEIVALSGGVGEKTRNFGFNRATDSERPCGSSIKPLSSYGPALEYGYITQTTLVNDSPEITLRGTSWYPTNSGGGYSGIVTIRQALTSSINTVAAQLVDKLTVDVCYDYLEKKLGFTTLVEADCDYAPLALGQFTNGVTVREMAQAYSSIVNKGVFTESRTYTAVYDSSGKLVLDNQPKTHIAWSENTAANLMNMLQNAVSGGTGTGAYFSSTAVGGKTGTTSNNFDRYFCGFTSYYVACVWTGYDTPERMYFYSNPAVSIWKSIMQPIHEGLEYLSFPTPIVGAPTGLFGDLDEEEEEDDTGDGESNPNETGNPDASPGQSQTPDTSDGPEVSPSENPAATPDGTSSPPATIEPEAPKIDVPEPENPVGGEFAG